jgi:hypothetical protein
MWKPRAELAIDHRTADRKQAAHAPEQENQHRIAEISRQQTCGREDAAPDDIADQEAARGKPTRWCRRVRWIEACRAFLLSGDSPTISADG